MNALGKLLHSLGIQPRCMDHAVTTSFGVSMHDTRARSLALANKEARMQCLAEAAPKDIADLIPILQARVRETTLAQQRALDELADALLASETNREKARG